MATAAYTLRLSPPPPPPQHPTALLPQFRPHLRRRAVAKLAVTWVPAGDASDDDGLGGWWLPECPIVERTGVGRAVAVGFGASAAIALVGLTWHFPSSRKCLQQLFTAPLHYVHEKLSVFNLAETSEDARNREPNVDEVSRTDVDEKINGTTVDLERNHILAGGGYVSVKAPVDPLHEEAFSVLKKLQIIENHASSNEFCTRREFARWFVKICSKLERKRKHKIIPNILISGSIIKAFDDVTTDDPDFLYIQSLGETGIVPSKLSCGSNTSASNHPNAEGNSTFLPDSCLSRFDLVSWKALVEHPSVYEIDEKMLSKQIGVLDLSACPDVSVSLLMDLMAGERSTLRKVFGNTRRLQPHKLVTKAQAAAALTCGRMEEVISDEVNRLEAENISQLAAMGEIMEELIYRGEIQKHWEAKLKKEQDRELEVEKDLQHALHELGNERTARQEELADLLKERTALEHQQQLLISLRSVVDGMYDRLATESAEIMAKRRNMEKLSSDVSNKHQAVTEARSYLEAEKEALTILRSWVEEEAARVHERAKILEKAVRRWRIPDDGVYKLA